MKDEIGLLRFWLPLACCCWAWLLVP